MTDRELLELAAKGAGYGFRWLSHEGGREVLRVCYSPDDNSRVFNSMDWNPLHDSGDAFRLAVHLKLILEPSLCQCNDIDYDHYGASDLADPVQAMRAAIVQCAAEIGKGMK